MDAGTFSFVVNEAGALAILALGIFVWRVRPRLAVNRSFAVMVGGWAIGLIVDNLSDVAVIPLAATLAVLTATWTASIAATIVFARAFPSPLSRREWRELGPLRHLVWAAPLAVVAISTALVPTALRIVAAEGVQVTALDLVFNTVQDTLWATWVGLGSLLALRYRAAPEDAAAFRSQAAHVALAVLLYPLFSEGYALFRYAPVAPSELTAAAGVVWVLLELTPAALWLHASRGPSGRLARRVGVLLPAIVLAGMLFGLLVRDDPGFLGGWGGTLRLVSTMIVGYAILKHQMFDIDLKVKWTLRQSTLAAVFLGVFFFVSEAASAFLGERTGSTYYGIAATTLLVFALAPLQRMADRLADAAMPRVRESPDYIESRKREIYSAAVASAMRDGVVTEAERDVLATLADELGLSAGEARAVERALTTDAAGAD